MPDVTDPPMTYEDAVRTLAHWHGEGGPADLRIYSFPDPEERVVRLVEVSDEFFTQGDIVPLALPPFPEYPFRSSVALATPDDWAAAEAGSRDLPRGFDPSSKEQVWP